MYFLIAGVVLFILLGAALAWRMQKATHYRGPDPEALHQHFSANNEHTHLHDHSGHEHQHDHSGHQHDHSGHEHQHDSAASIHQGQSTPHPTPPAVPPTTHIHP